MMGDDGGHFTLSSQQLRLRIITSDIYIFSVIGVSDHQESSGRLGNGASSLVSTWYLVKRVIFFSFLLAVLSIRRADFRRAPHQTN